MKIVILLICVNSVWSYNTRYIEQKVVQRTPDLDSSERVNGDDVEKSLQKQITIEIKKCRPNSYSFDECNLCKCNALGTQERCTHNDCVAQKQRGMKVIKRRIYEDLGATGSCKPNTWYAMHACQFCYCQRASKLVCSTRSSAPRPINVGSYDLTDCGQGLVKELYDLSATPDPVSRTNNVEKQKSYATDAPGHIKAESSRAVPYSLAEDEPKSIRTNEETMQETWANLLPHKNLEDTPSNHLPVKHMDDTPSNHLPLKHVDDTPSNYLPHKQVDHRSSWKIEQPLPWTMNEVMDPSIKDTISSQVSTSAGTPTKFFLPLRTSSQNSKQVLKTYTPLKHQYNAEYEEHPQYDAEYEDKEESTLSPFEKDEEAMHLNFAKNEIINFKGFPKEMTDMLASLREESQTPSWEQESKRLEARMTERHFSKKERPLNSEDQELTLQMNLPTSLQRIIQLALRKSMVRIDASQTCTPGDTTKDGCNYCYCLKNGKMLCTDKKTC